MATINDFLGGAGAVLPLFIVGGFDGETPLSIFGSPPLTSADKQLPLFISGLAFTSNQLNLKTIGYLGAEKTLNLFIGGTGNPVSAEFPLFLFNNQAARVLPLFIQGLGIIDDAIPFGKALNLFIKRPISAWLPLTLQNPGNLANSELPLFTLGSGFSSGSLPLSIPNVSVLFVKTLPLYIHGF
jgi:hypothetical protein